MKMVQANGRVVTEDRPVGLWLFGAFFVFGGVLCATLGITGELDESGRVVAPWMRQAAFFMGVAHIVAGLWFTEKHPARRAEFDPAAGRLCMDCRGLFSRDTEVIAYTDLVGLTVIQGRDDDGDAVFRPEVVRKDGQRIPLVSGWRSTEEDIAEFVGQLAQAVGLPVVASSRPPKPPLPPHPMPNA